MYLIHSVLITCLTPVCVHVSNSISSHYLFYTCVTVCTCFYFDQCMLSVQHVCVCVHVSKSLHITSVCVHVVHNISAALLLYAEYLHVSLHQYTYSTCVCTCIIKSVHILYLCVHMNIITIQSVYNVRACVHCLSAIS